MTRDSDIVDYLLGELGPDDRARVEARMRDDAAFREEVERMRPVVGGLEAMPAGAWDEDAALPPLPALPPLGALQERRARRWPPALRPAYAVAACIAVLAIGVAIGAVVTDRGADAGPAIALARFGEGGPGAQGVARVVSTDGGEMRLQVSGLAPSRGREFYELWLLDGPTDAMSLGSFRVPASGRADVTVPLAVPMRDFRFIDVSVEPEDGVATHSGRSVLRAPTTA